MTYVVEKVTADPEIADGGIVVVLVPHLDDGQYYPACVLHTGWPEHRTNIVPGAVVTIEVQSPEPAEQ